MPKTYYTSKFNYKNGYDNPSIRGQEDARPWDLFELIQNVASLDNKLLDIGCGSALKLIDIARLYFSITGLDCNNEMLDLARKRFSSNNIHNYSLVYGTAKNLPFDKDTFDVITSMMAPHDIHEIFRVLKPGGWTIIETIGEMDKKALKDFFIDGTTARGQLSDRPEGSTKLMYKNELESLFEKITITDGFWETRYTIEGILSLLLNTPTVLNFDLARDMTAYEKAIRLLPKKNEMIVLTQHRVLILAQKPRA
jgi:SAM-dependent methyltransferase